MIRRQFAVVALGLSLATFYTGCASLVPYTPSTRAGSNPQNEIEKLLAANSGGRVAVPEFKEGFFFVKSVAGGYASQQTVRCEQLSKIELFKYSSTFYRVTVTDRAQNEVFIWGVATLDDAQALADAISSYCAPQSGQPRGDTTAWLF